MVTGGKGFLGQHVFEELAARGDLAVAFDRPHDVRNAEELLEQLDGCDSVIHLAGVLGTHELFERADEAVDVNIRGTLNVLRACKEHGAGYVGIGMPAVWDNVYQATRRAALILANAWRRHYDVPVSHVTAYNAYGAGQHVGSPQKIIPTFAARSWDGKPIPIWGDGSQTVDLIWAGDVARMLVDATQFGGGETFDAGTGTAVTVLEIAQMVGEHTGNVYNLNTAQLEFLPMRLGEHGIDILAAEGKGWDLLDWKPEYDESRILETVDWYKTHRP